MNLMNLMNLHELKINYKTTQDENKKNLLRKLLDKKITDSQQVWYKPEPISFEKNLFTRMMAEAEALENIQTDKIDKPLYDIENNHLEKNNTNKGKNLGKRKDLF